MSMHSINVMLKPASGMCNMCCKYCFYADETKKRAITNYGLMSFDTLHSVLEKFIGSNSVMHDCIPGRGTNIGGSAVLSAGNQHL